MPRGREREGVRPRHLPVRPVRLPPGVEWLHLRDAERAAAGHGRRGVVTDVARSSAPRRRRRLPAARDAANTRPPQRSVSTVVRRWRSRRSPPRARRRRGTCGVAHCSSAQRRRVGALASSRGRGAWATRGSRGPSDCSADTALPRRRLRAPRARRGRRLPEERWRTRNVRAQPVLDRTAGARFAEPLPSDRARPVGRRLLGAQAVPPQRRGRLAAAG